MKKFEISKPTLEYYHFFAMFYFLCENVTLEEHKIKLLLNVTPLKEKQQQQKNVTQSC
jgi:hypothetical protein